MFLCYQTVNLFIKCLINIKITNFCLVIIKLTFNISRYTKHISSADDVAEVVVATVARLEADFLLNERRKELFSLEGARTCLKSLMGDCLKRSATLHASKGLSEKR